jgi:hypothetical protein
MAIITDPEAELRRLKQEYAMAAAQNNNMFGTTTGIGTGIGNIIGGGSSIFQGVYQSPPEFITTPHTMIYHATVERAENGFILKVTHKQGETPKVYVAGDAEELQRVFIAAIVGERISK